MTLKNMIKIRYFQQWQVELQILLPTVKQFNEFSYPIFKHYYICAYYAL